MYNFNDSVDPHKSFISFFRIRFLLFFSRSYVANRPLSDADPTGYAGGAQHAHPVRHAIFKVLIYYCYYLFFVYLFLL